MARTIEGKKIKLLNAGKISLTGNCSLSKMLDKELAWVFKVWVIDGYYIEVEQLVTEEEEGIQQPELDNQESIDLCRELDHHLGKQWRKFNILEVCFY